MVKAGTIHAIGAGILICEIQQNSNSTYRMYDYDRRDKFGNTRELHVDKAIDVVDTKKFVMPDFNAGVADEVAATSEFEAESASSSASLYDVGEDDTEVAVLDGGHYCRLLVQCKYFQCWKYDVRECARIAVDQASFVSVVFLKGSGTIEVNGDVKEFKAGESFFVSAGQKMVVVRGECEAIVTRV